MALSSPRALNAPVAPSQPQGYSPAQIRAAYDINDIRFGSVVGNGAGQTIAIIDLKDDPDLVDTGSPGFATSDLAMFDKYFGLPNPPSFTKVNEYGSPSDLPGPVAPDNSGQTALDVEWAHAVAPAAKIVLVELNSGSTSDFSIAQKTAARLPGVSVVSESYGSPDAGGERAQDRFFRKARVTYTSGAGDNGPPGNYPGYSPYVIAVGGTTLRLDSSGDYPGTSRHGETAWSDTGGGVSRIEPEPTYQDAVQDTGHRSIPDVAFDANPNTGVAVYDSVGDPRGGPWQEEGGTSLGAPAWAGLIAIADQGRILDGGKPLTGYKQTLSALYSLPPSDFHDIVHGSNGRYHAEAGYDDTTGHGSPIANRLVPDLAAYGLADAAALTSRTTPPTLEQESTLHTVYGPKKHIDGIQLLFSEPMGAAAADYADYAVTRTIKVGGKAEARPVPFSVVHVTGSAGVRLMFAGPTKFLDGGRLSVAGSGPDAIASAAGVPLDGDDIVVDIHPKARGFRIDD